MKAVVLFNLGGPDCLQHVRPFLFNLFYDPAILRIANPFRYLLALLISRMREKEACKIYKYLGGGSPIVSQTNKQRDALQKSLGQDYQVFTTMRYWSPFAKDIIHQLKPQAFEEIILLPLYPQYSSTTTQSFFDHWDQIATDLGLMVHTRKICCYPNNQLYIQAHQQIIRTLFQETTPFSEIRFVFSAHGLPEKIVKGGDPYQQQIESSVNQILKGIPEIQDSVICYQSRVGPLKWLGPSIDEEIRRAGKDGKSIAVVPVSFVSEHSETLYELDYLYKKLAQDLRIPSFFRLPTLQDHPFFIKALVGLVQDQITETCTGSLCKIQCLQKAA